FTLISMSATGAVNWERQLGNVDAMYAWHDSEDNWALAVDDGGYGELLSESGADIGGQPIPYVGVGGDVELNPTASGGLIVDETPYGSSSTTIALYNSSGEPITPSSDAVPSFSTVDLPNGPGSMPSLSGGGAVEVGSTIYVEAGNSGMAVFTATGVLEGTVSNDSGDLGDASYGGSLSYDPATGDLYWENDNYTSSPNIMTVPLTTLQSVIADGAPPPQEDGFSDYLGAGAGLSTNAIANYFAPGQTPNVTATFEPWWEDYPNALEFSYSVEDEDQVQANNTPAPTITNLSWSGVTSGNSLSVPLDVSSTPGTYLVNADLIDTTSHLVIGSTCLTYSVAMPGDSLDFGTLAENPSYGGPPAVRGVQLAAELGTGLYRAQINLGALFPNCTSDPGASTCGPAGMSDSAWIANYSDFGEAVTTARTLGVNFEVQVGQSGSTDMYLV
ncbi:MAG: hypothetical protein ACRD6W_00250, partial [Nitrososphaerales archaeon]